jgi:hypothetical protein
MRQHAPAQSVRDITDATNELLYREEMISLQRSQIDWLKEGDRNTMSFHRKVVWWARKNKIKSLEDEDGVVTEAHSDME